MSSETLKVTCQGCGKALRLPAHQAGQSIKCPACGEIQQVPDEPADQVVFACPECGQQMRADAEHAGQLTRCPGCGADSTIPGRSKGAGDRIRADAPVHARRAAASEEDEDERPVRVRARQRKTWPWVAMVLLLLILAGGGVAAWWFLFRGRTDDLAYIPADAQGFASVRVADLWNTDLVKESRKAAALFAGDLDKLIEGKVGLTPADVERVTGVVMDGEKKIVWAVVATSKTYDEKKLLSLWLPSAKENKANNKSYYVGDFQKEKVAVHFASSKLLLVGTAEGIKYALEMKPQSSGPLEDAISLIRKKHHVVAAVSTQSPVIQKELKKEIGSKLPAAADVKVATLTLDLDKKLEVAARVDFANEASAKETQKMLDAGLVQAKQMWQQNKDKLKKDMERSGMPLQGMLDQVDTTLNSVKTDVKGSALSVSASAEVNAALVGMLLPAVQKVREAAARTSSMNNIHQIGIAFHNYLSAYNVMPPAVIYSKTTGQPLYSWRVAILPYIEQENLYRQFHLEEPWDSPHNRTLIPLMPKVYAAPDDPPGQTKTRYQLLTTSVDPMRDFAGAMRTPFNTKKQNGPRIPVDFQDGTSNTILVVEAKQPVEWTKPEDVPFTTAEALKNQLYLRGGVFTVGLADGSVRSIFQDISTKTLEAAVTPSGNDLLGPDW